MNPFVSIIVPVYNVQDYISDCLDSLVNQTLKHIEIIIVDDGSTDASGKIADRYALDYPEKVRVFHKKNSGVGSARNLGIKHALGQYIGYVDSDDYTEADMYEKFYNKAREGYDIVMCGFRLVDALSKETVDIYKLPDHVDYNNIKNIMCYSTTDITPSPCNKIYKKEIILSSPEFIDGLCEDVFAIPMFMSKAERVGIIDEPLYNYRVNRKESAMNTSKDDPKYLNIINVWEKLLSQTSDKHYEEIVCAVYIHMFIVINAYPSFKHEYKIYFNKVKSSMRNNKYILEYVAEHRYNDLFDMVEISLAEYNDLKYVAGLHANSEQRKLKRKFKRFLYNVTYRIITALRLKKLIKSTKLYKKIRGK